jgi:hypothetical protein
MDTVHEPLHSDEVWYLAVEKIIVDASFISIIILFDEIFKYVDGANF